MIGDRKHEEKMHSSTKEVMANLDLSRFDKISGDQVHEKFIDDVQMIVSSKLERYDLSEGDRRNRKNGFSMEPIARATRVMQDILKWNAKAAAIKNQDMGLPYPKFNNVLELVKDTADHYRGQ